MSSSVVKRCCAQKRNDKIVISVWQIFAMLGVGLGLDILSWSSFFQLPAWCLGGVWFSTLGVLYLNSMYWWESNTIRGIGSLSKRVSLKSAWMISIGSSFVHSSVCMYSDFVCGVSSSMYYLTDCWKTLAVVIMNQYVRQLAHPLDSKLDADVYRWVDRLLPYVYLYIALTVVVVGVMPSGGLWAAYEVGSCCAILACPCVLTCLQPLMQLAMNVENSIKKVSVTRQEKAVKQRMRQNMVFVQCYYVLSLFVASVGKWWFKFNVRPWHGALMMLTSQCVLFMNTLVRPLTLPRTCKETYQASRVLMRALSSPCKKPGVTKVQMLNSKQNLSFM